MCDKFYVYLSLLKNQYICPELVGVIFVDVEIAN